MLYLNLLLCIEASFKQNLWRYELFIAIYKYTKSESQTQIQKLIHKNVCSYLLSCIKQNETQLIAKNFFINLYPKKEKNDSYFHMIKIIHNILL